MENEITMQDIQNAINNLKSKPWKTFENDIAIFEFSDYGMETIQLKPLGRDMVNEFIEEIIPRVKNSKIKTLFGIQIVISDDVEELELK